MNFLKSDYITKVFDENGIKVINPINKKKSNSIVKSKLDFFIDYEFLENKSDLVEKMEQNIFIKELKNKIGFNKSFIEVGSGSAQLSNSLAIGSNNNIVAIDMAKESLEIGSKFAKANDIENVIFLNTSIFDNPIKDNFFDYVWLNSLVNKKGNINDSLKIVSKWCKKDGTIIISCLSSFGRLKINFIRMIYRFFLKLNIIKSLIFHIDPILKQNISLKQKEIWFNDNYEKNDYNTYRLYDIIKLFEHNNIKFVGSIPDTDFEGQYIGFENMNGNFGSVL
ncbi:class I SAM-dependent methyltransferase, partial [bacterium]|nr:class I SAM-dependent methyltransferase [bacterium]